MKPSQAKACFITVTASFFAPVFLSLFFLAIPGAGAEDRAESFSQGAIPLISKGLRLAVKTVINGQNEAELIIDTGSSFTIISEKTARRLRLHDLGGAPRFPVSTVAGEAWLRLVVFESVNIGGAMARNVEGAVSPHLGKDVDGVIGLSFLNDFVYKIDGRKKELTLKRLGGAGPLMGERGRQWWSLKFSRYSNTIGRYSSYLRNYESRLKAPDEQKGGSEANFTKNDLKKIIQYYKKLHRLLNTSAKSANVPESWKTYP